MPDIAMCSGDQCPLKNNCYRFTAQPDYMQSYFSEPPYQPNDKFCPYYMPPRALKTNSVDNGSKSVGEK